MKLELSVKASIAAVDAVAWNACAGASPVVQHAFFMALEQSGSLGADRGVVMRYVLLHDASGRLVACAPAMYKAGNKREFGPEIHWLKAGKESGCFAWPKFQVGSPFYPMMGPKLLIHPALSAVKARVALLQQLYRIGRRSDGRSAFTLAHVCPEVARECLSQGALISHEWRSVWTNQAYASFDDYLAALPHRKRYQVRKERNQVRQMGLQHRVLDGHQITLQLRAQFYEGFGRVCARYGGRPWIPLTMFDQLCQRMPESVVLLAAFDGDRFVAGSFNFVDESNWYGDTWSAMEELPALCFELVCYKPIELAIERGLKKVDSGLLGRHKASRGYATEPVYHAHWFYNNELKALAQNHLTAASQAMKAPAVKAASTKNINP